MTIIRPRIDAEILVVGEPLSVKCFEMKIRTGHQDAGPEEMGYLPNLENHGLIYQFKKLYAIGPNMVTSGVFSMEREWSRTHKSKWIDLEKFPLMNTNLQTMCIFGSENIGVIAGIHFDIRKVEQGAKPQIRIERFASKRDFVIQQKLYPQEHKQNVMCMVAFNDGMLMLTFGLDNIMKKWIIEETVTGRSKVGRLKCIDSWFIPDEAVTCAKVTRGGRFLITGSFRGTVMIIDPNKKYILTSFFMKVRIPVNSVEEGFNDPDDSCVYAIGDVLASIQKFRLSKKQYEAIYGGIEWEVRRETSEYMRRHPRQTALLRPYGNHRVKNYKDAFERDSIIMNKFTHDRK